MLSGSSAFSFLKSFLNYIYLRWGFIQFRWWLGSEVCWEALQRIQSMYSFLLTVHSKYITFFIPQWMVMGRLAAGEFLNLTIQFTSLARFAAHSASHTMFGIHFRLSVRAFLLINLSATFYFSNNPLFIVLFFSFQILPLFYQLPNFSEIQYFWPFEWKPRTQLLIFV